RRAGTQRCCRRCGVSCELLSGVRRERILPSDATTLVETVGLGQGLTPPGRSCYHPDSARSGRDRAAVRSVLDDLERDRTGDGDLHPSIAQILEGSLHQLLAVIVRLPRFDGLAVDEHDFVLVLIDLVVQGRHELPGQVEVEL